MKFFYKNNVQIGNSIPAASGNTAPINGVSSQVTASRNYISGAFNGILFTNHQFQEVRDELNTIVMQYQPTVLTTESTQYGIQHSYCIYNLSSSGYGNDIYNNTITGTFATSYTFNSSNQTGFEPKKGIWVNYSNNHYVTCNTVSDAGRGFEFQGAQTSIYWAKNTMAHNGEAFALTSSGVIGTQSTTVSGVGYSNSNQWTSTTNTWADTYVDASNAASSPLWLQGNTWPTGPVNNFFGTGTPYSYFPANLVQPKPANPYACSIPPTRIAHHENGTLTERSGQSSSQAYDISFLEQVVNDSIPYPAYYSQNSFINKNMVYRLLRSNSSLTASSSILAAFLNSNANSSWALMCQIEDSLAATNLNYASSLVGSFSPANSIEQNYKRYYQMYINGAQGNFTAQDTADLEALASSCPMLNGTVVYQARALHMGYYNCKHPRNWDGI